MSTDRIFAITIPCYNSETTIAETLQGIMAQGEDALRRVACVVIADDVTPDHTLDVVRRIWTLASPPLKFEKRRKNVGEMINVNMAVAALPEEIEWFLHMHGDNIPKPGWLRVLTDRCLAADPAIGIVCASYDVFDQHGRMQHGEDRPGAPPVLVKGSVASLRDTVRRGCWWHNSCSAMRVSAWRETGGLPPGMRQKGDWDFLLRILKAGWDIEYLPQTLMLYRDHTGSASGFAFKTHLDIEESLQVIQKHAAQLTWRDICVTHFQYEWFLLRRAGAAVLRGDFARAAAAVRMLFRTAFSCLSCLAS